MAKLKPAGIGTKLLAMVFMSIVGAGGGIFLFLYLFGQGGADFGTTSSGIDIFSRIFWGFALCGALSGASSVIVCWPSKDENEDHL